MNITRKIQETIADAEQAMEQHLQEKKLIDLMNDLDQKRLAIW